MLPPMACPGPVVERYAPGGLMEGHIAEKATQHAFRNDYGIFRSKFRFVITALITPTAATATATARMFLDLVKLCTT